MAPRLRANTAAGLLRAGLVAAIGWFYFWTAVPEMRSGLIGTEGSGYYNLLTRGFMKGELSLDLKADPFLATLRNPLDPAERAGHGLYDASYYKGRYYLYFGVTPVVLLFLPFRLLTGHFIDESLASPLFACAGLVASVCLLLAARRRYFPRAPEAVATGCVLALGLTDMMPSLLRRSWVYEVPITCAYACCAVGFGAIYRALHSRRRTLWLAIAGAAFGLAVGSRPLYLFGCCAVATPLVLDARERRLGVAPWRDLDWRRLALAALAPLAAIGAGLAAYNFLRFGNALDFGLRHQMGGGNLATIPYFSWRFFWYNLRIYAFAPAGWSSYFPFVTPASVPPSPPGIFGGEDPYGILLNIPFAILCLGVLESVGPRRPAGRDGLAALCLSILAAAAGTGLAMTFFGAASNRYMVDFLPGFILLACFGWLGIATRERWRSSVRAAASAIAFALLAYSATFNVLASLLHNNLLRDQHPALYQRVARRWNWVSYALDRCLGTVYGPIEMNVIFPNNARGTIEPLVATGRSAQSDYLMVEYLQDGAVRFGFGHTGGVGTFGMPVMLSADRVHQLRIDMGSLYPPAAHPYFDRYSPEEARLRQGTLRVTCDGQVVLDHWMVFYDAASRTPSIGTTDGRPGYPHPFSGKIVSWRKMPEAGLQPSPSKYGALRLELILPPFRVPRSEPLLSTGEPGRGDLLYLRYENASRVSIGYDHWGAGGDVSAPIKVDPHEVQSVEIDFGALHPRPPNLAEGVSGGTGRLLVRLDGRTALDEAAPYYFCEPDTVAAGLNVIGASTADARFTGSITSNQRLP